MIIILCVYNGYGNENRVYVGGTYMHISLPQTYYTTASHIIYHTKPNCHSLLLLLGLYYSGKCIQVNQKHNSKKKKLNKTSKVHRISFTYTMLYVFDNMRSAAYPIAFVFHFYY